MRFFVTCAKGTEGALRRELVELRIRAPRGDQGGVSFEGPLSDGVKTCLWSRVGMRVLLELASFEVPDAEALYESAREVAWHEILSTQSTFAVSAHVNNNPALRHSGFVALKVKDAIADCLRDRLGARPNVEPKDPDVSVMLHIEGSSARLYLDLAGEPLHRRGYRVAMTEAPLKESLAASVLALGDVRLDQPLLDPMTGSGTFAIEQALRARRIAPGLARSFGFERWPSDEGRKLLQPMRDEARDFQLPKAPAPIFARDLHGESLASARRNARAAGVERDIDFDVDDARALAAPRGPAGSVCINPPYGERLDAPPPRTGRTPPNHDLARLYQDVARALVAFRGWQLVVLAGNPLFLNALSQRPLVSHRLWNGPLEARLLRYSL